jgi:hypothetical protein
VSSPPRPFIGWPTICRFSAPIVCALWVCRFQGAAGQSQTFRARTDLIQLDVSVS